MTEDEAKNSRCCGPVGCGDQVYRKEDDKVVGNIERMCIASRCMAWAWSRDEVEEVGFGGGISITTPPAGDGWRLRNQGWLRKKTPTGYCGLAGQLA